MCAPVQRFKNNISLALEFMTDKSRWYDRAGAKHPLTMEGDCSRLPFNHALEMEYFLVTNRGKKLGHGAVEKIYGKIVDSDLGRILQKRMPAEYKKKMIEIYWGQSKGSTYDALKIDYDVRGKKVSNELVSIDRNVVEWPVLEIATPPADSFYELAWWTSALISLIVERLDEINLKVYVMAAGSNPYEDLQEAMRGESFPTCGDHHHIGILMDPDSREQRDILTNFYHLMRMFLPNIAVLSANSPFIDGKIMGRIRYGDYDAPFPGSVRSLRIMHNKKHLCNFSAREYVPYLKNGWQGPDYFISEFKKQNNSFRTNTHFLDMDPWSPSNHTTEIRISDSQPSVARRIGIAMIIQAIALKAKHIAEGEPINAALKRAMKTPNRELFDMKKVAAQGGNWFKPRKPSVFSSNPKKLKYSRFSEPVFSDTTLEMLHFLSPVFKEMKLTYSLFLNPIRASVYACGGNGSSLAQYWMLDYARNNSDMEKVVKHMIKATRNGRNMWYDPMTYHPVTCEEALGGKGSAAGKG